MQSLKNNGNSNCVLRNNNFLKHESFFSFFGSKTHSLSDDGFIRKKSYNFTGSWSIVCLYDWFPIFIFFDHWISFVYIQKTAIPVIIICSIKPMRTSRIKISSILLIFLLVSFTQHQTTQISGNTACNTAASSPLVQTGTFFFSCRHLLPHPSVQSSLQSQHLPNCCQLPDPLLRTHRHSLYVFAYFQLRAESMVTAKQWEQITRFGPAESTKQTS